MQTMCHEPVGQPRRTGTAFYRKAQAMALYSLYCVLCLKAACFPHMAHILKSWSLAVRSNHLEVLQELEANQSVNCINWFIIWWHCLEVESLSKHDLENRSLRIFSGLPFSFSVSWRWIVLSTPCFLKRYFFLITS